MKRLAIFARMFLAAAILLAALAASAKEDDKAAKPQENRFLFLVDTAFAMRGYSNAIVQNVVDLLATDMRGEFRKGDTIGLWTYNDTLHPEFPMQVWSRDDKTTIIADMGSYLHKHRFSSRARLDKVLPALGQVIKNSERITVILIFDGAGLIQGTPFDREINDLQKKYARELKAAHVPFILVLAARKGAIFDYTINYPGLIAIPHTANPEPPPETNAAAAVVSAPVETPAPVHVGPPIFISGAHKPAHVEEPAPAQVVAPPAPPPQPAPVVVTAPVAAPAPPVQITPPPAPVVAAPVVVPPPAPIPVPAPVEVQQSAPPASEPPPAKAEPAETAINTPPPPVPAPVPRVVAVASAPPSGNHQIMLLAAAFLLLTVAIVLGVFLVRRSKPAPQSSFISQSIDRPR